MRRALVLSILLVSASALPLAAEGENGSADSHISRVVVYPRSAEVTREKAVDVAIGLNPIKFGGLVAGIDSANLRASSEDGVEIVGIEVQRRFLTEPLSKRLAEIDEAIESRALKLREFERALARVAEEWAFYGMIRQSTAESIQRATKGELTAVADWKNILEFVREGLEGLDKRRLEIENAQRDENVEMERIKRERETLASRAPQEMKEVTVTVRAARAGKVTVRLHYVVADVSWEPSYDVHLYTRENRVRITAYGLVVQGTGEAWDEVELVLARAQAESRLNLPEIQPIVVRLTGQEINHLKSDILALNSSGDSSLWLQTRFSDERSRANFCQNVYSLGANDDQFLLENGLDRGALKVALERLQDRFSSVRYELAKKETVLADRSAHKVVVFSELVPADLKHVSIPAIQPMVIRKGLVTNSTAYPILAGSSSVFVDGSYVGAGEISSVSSNEKLSLFFGPDDRIRVKREIASQETRGPEKFRQSQLVTYEYAIEIENYNDHAVELELQDQIPISQSDDIQVKFLGSSVEGAEPDAKGVLTWKIGLEPRAKTRVTYRYQIEHPTNRAVYQE